MFCHLSLCDKQAFSPYKFKNLYGALLWQLIIEKYYVSGPVTINLCKKWMDGVFYFVWRCRNLIPRKIFITRQLKKYSQSSCPPVSNSDLEFVRNQCQYQLADFLRFLFFIRIHKKVRRYIEVTLPPPLKIFKNIKKSNFSLKGSISTYVSTRTEQPFRGFLKKVGEVLCLQSR